MSPTPDPGEPGEIAAPILSSVTGSGTSRTVSGQAEAGSEVSIYGNANCEGDAIGSDIVSDRGEFAIPVTVAEGAETAFSAKAALDELVSECSGSSLVVDLKAPEAPLLHTISPEPRFDFSNVNDPVLGGTAEPGSKIHVCGDAPCTSLGEATADSQGNFLVTANLEDNATYHLRVWAVDGAGNESPLSVRGIAYVEDSIPPPPPALLLGQGMASPSRAIEFVAVANSQSRTQVKIYSDSQCTPENQVRAVPVPAPAPDTPPEDPSQTEPDPSMGGEPSPTDPGDPAVPTDPTVEPLVGEPGEGPPGNEPPQAEPQPPYPAVWPNDPVTIQAAPNYRNEYYAKATDFAGNESACSTEPLIYEHDTAPPLPFSGSYTKFVSLVSLYRFTFTAAEAFGLSYTIERGPCLPEEEGLPPTEILSSGVALPFAFTVYEGFLADGPEVIAVKLMDALGNTRCQTFEATFAFPF